MLAKPFLNLRFEMASFYTEAELRTTVGATQFTFPDLFDKVYFPHALQPQWYEGKPEPKSARKQRHG